MFSECEETPGICSFMITLGSILIGKHTKTEKLWMFSLEILLKENLRIDLKTYPTHCTERELFSNHSTIWWERNLTNRERDPWLTKYLSKLICIGVNFSARYSSLLPALHHKSCPGNYNNQSQHSIKSTKNTNMPAHPWSLIVAGVQSKMYGPRIQEGTFVNWYILSTEKSLKNWSWRTKQAAEMSELWAASNIER